MQLQPDGLLSSKIEHRLHIPPASRRPACVSVFLHCSVQISLYATRMNHCNRRPEKINALMSVVTTLKSDMYHLLPSATYR